METVNCSDSSSSPKRDCWLIADVLVLAVPRAFVFVDEKMRSRSTAQQILSFVDDKVDQFHRIAGGLSFVDKIPKR